MKRIKKSTTTQPTEENMVIDKAKEPGTATINCTKEGTLNILSTPYDMSTEIFNNFYTEELPLVGSFEQDYSYLMNMASIAANSYSNHVTHFIYNAIVSGFNNLEYSPLACPIVDSFPRERETELFEGAERDLNEGNSMLVRQRGYITKDASTILRIIKESSPFLFNVECAVFADVRCLDAICSLITQYVYNYFMKYVDVHNDIILYNTISFNIYTFLVYNIGTLNNSAMKYVDSVIKSRIALEKYNEK